MLCLFGNSSLPFVILCLLCLPSLGFACLLCPLHIPARPKPLDQFRLPSIEKLVRTAETFEWLCQNGSRLSDVSPACRSEVSHLFCSLSQLAQSLKTECPGAEQAEQCAQCRGENDRLYAVNKWVLTWVDSVGKMPSGISDGNYHWLGDYEQCQRLKEQQLFNGRYCLLEFHVPDAILRPEQCPEDNFDPLEVVLGICLPANCSREETQGLVEYVADHRPILVNCEPASRQWPLAGILLVGISLFWLALLLCVSALHWLRPSLHLQMGQPLLLALCLQNNLRHSLRTTLPSKCRGPLISRWSAIPGLQVLIVSLLVLSQAQVLVLPYLENIGHHYAFLDSWLAQPLLLNPTLLADSLLALSAFQLAISFGGPHSSPSSSSPPNSPFPLIWRRFLRLWPQFALATLAMAFVFSRLGEGPMWSRSDIDRRCAANWPQNLLLIQNLLGFSHTCLDAGHLLALEAQFLLLGLFALYFLAHPPARHFLLVLCLLAILMFSCLFCLAISLLFRLPPTLIPHRPIQPLQFGQLLDLLILNPLARAGPPLVGLLFAKSICPLLDNGQWLNLLRSLSPIAILLSILGLGLLLWTPFWLPPAHSPFGALYAAFHRPLWAALLLGLLLLVQSNPKGGIAKFLGWRVFRPLAKLLFPVLLLAEPIALSFFASLHRPVHSTPLSALLAFVGILVCSFLLAFAIDAALSRPIRQICCCFEKTPEMRIEEEQMEEEREMEGKKH